MHFEKKPTKCYKYDSVLVYLDVARLNLNKEKSISSQIVVVVVAISYKYIYKRDKSMVWKFVFFCFHIVSTNTDNNFTRNTQSKMVQIGFKWLSIKKCLKIRYKTKLVSTLCVYNYWNYWEICLFMYRNGVWVQLIRNLNNLMAMLR